MNMVVNCNSYGCLWNMVIHVQLLVLMWKWIMLSSNFLLGHFTQFNSQTKAITLLNKTFKLFVSKKITLKHRKINIKYFIKIWRRTHNFF
jgi:hypothetical protein